MHGSACPARKDWDCDCTGGDPAQHRAAVAVRNLGEDRRRPPLATATMPQARVVLHACPNAAVADGLIPADPATPAKVARRGQPKGPRRSTPTAVPTPSAPPPPAGSAPCSCPDPAPGTPGMSNRTSRAGRFGRLIGFRRQHRSSRPGREVRPRASYERALAGGRPDCLATAAGGIEPIGFAGVSNTHGELRTCRWCWRPLREGARRSPTTPDLRRCDREAVHSAPGPE